MSRETVVVWLCAAQNGHDSMERGCPGCILKIDTKNNLKIHLKMTPLPT